MTNQTPSVRPSDESTLAGVLKLATRKAAQQQDGMLPVEVVSYDRATNRATVKHLVQMTGSDGEAVSRAQVSSVRVMQPGNATFNISMPIKAGDKGWLFAADRDMSVFQSQGLREAPPNTERVKSFQDGVFMPDAMSNGDAPSGHGDNVIIGLNGGDTYISLGSGAIELYMGDNVLTLDASGLTVTAGGNTLSLTSGGLEMNGKNIGDDHTHGGVTSGASSTGAPN